jgi:squalene-hopene/tetraprenyl-beta-curcumene cyclase
MRRLMRFLAVLLLAGVARAADPPKPAPNRPDEPVARALSADNAAAFLDGVAVAWTNERKCGTCHTNFAYLWARPALKGGDEATKTVRGFFEKRVANWDSGQKADAPRNPTEVVATATALALHDARTSGKLHPLTRKALDRMWDLQAKDGAWDWVKCDWPPLEHDDYFGAVVAALGVGNAPEGYAATDKAKPGLERLRGYFRKVPPPDLHHKALLLWAAQKVDGLLTKEEQAAAVAELRARQHADGGWGLPQLGTYKRLDDKPPDPGTASDGYATGLAVFVLRQAGVGKDDPAVRKGVVWLTANQRESGRWFTRSLNTDRHHFISHAGTALAVLALGACDALPR